MPPELPRILTDDVVGVRWARWYFAVQALGGIMWWVGVFTVPWVRRSTLGGLDPVLVGILDVPLFVVASALVAAGLRPLIWVAVPWTVLVTAAMVGYASITGQAGWGALIMIAAACGSLGAGEVLRRGRLPAELLLRGPFRFRVARASSRGRLVRQTFAQLAVFWLLFLVVLPGIILWCEHRWGLGLELQGAVAGIVAAVGGVVLLGASLLGVWSAWTMCTLGEGTPLPAAQPRRLVTAGPYRHLRNPMAVAGIVQGVAVGMLVGSWLVIAYAVAGSLIWNTLVRPLEEADLAARFGAEFDEYRRRVGVWLPRWESLRTRT
ncbi:MULTISPECIES: isoprenylcysteine carboxylmethyltransferase family protein [Actinomycetes]|uniref:Isoprenylcysteine carboxylmethyltransferase family protein n=2 Tax=Actinomycetes TaxID=1760 RepID=A0ABP6LU96_9MICC